MIKGCDNTSVGVVIERGNEIVLLRRARFPVGIAPPAGHIDGHGSPWQAAVDEAREELGLVVATNALIQTAISNRRVDNQCRRMGGDHHRWWVYVAREFAGELRPSEEETRGADWHHRDEVQALADRTQAYRDGRITEDQWVEQPGLEEVWVDFMAELGYIRQRVQ